MALALVSSLFLFAKSPLPHLHACAGCAAWERWAKGWAAIIPHQPGQPLAPSLVTGEEWGGNTWQHQQTAVLSPKASADCVAYVSIAQPGVHPPTTAAATVDVPPPRASASSAPSAAVSSAVTLPLRQGSAPSAAVSSAVTLPLRQGSAPSAAVSSAVTLPLRQGSAVTLPLRRQASAGVAASATRAAIPLVSHLPPVRDSRLVPPALLRPYGFTFPAVTPPGAIPSAQLPPLSHGLVYTAAAAAINSSLPLGYAPAATRPMMLPPLSHAAPQQQQHSLTAAIPQHPLLASADVAPRPEEWQGDEESYDDEGEDAEVIQPRPRKRKVSALRRQDKTCIY